MKFLGLCFRPLDGGLNLVWSHVWVAPLQAVPEPFDPANQVPQLLRVFGQPGLRRANTLGIFELHFPRHTLRPLGRKQVLADWIDEHGLRSVATNAN